MKRTGVYLLATALGSLPVIGSQKLTAKAAEHINHKAECAMAVAELLRTLNCPASSIHSIMPHIDEQEAQAIAELNEVDFPTVKARVIQELQVLYLKKKFKLGVFNTKGSMTGAAKGSSLRRFIAQAVATAVSDFQQFLNDNHEEIVNLIEETLKQLLQENPRISDQAIRTITNGKSLENISKNWKSIQSNASAPQPVPCSC